MSEDLTVTAYRAVAYTRDPTTTDDEDQGMRPGSRWINTATHRVFICTRATLSNAKWFCTTIPSATTELVTADLCTRNTLYTVACNFTYPGSDVAPLSSVQVVARVNSENAAHTFDLRLVDTSNNDAVLAQVTGLTGIHATLRTLGTLSNVPTATAVLEVHVRRSGAASSDTVQVSVVQVVYT